jgi:beta-glucosidase/6-phospho-beta-glucosidase/beta-galactosidase
VVTLHHFTHPSWLGTDPWLDGPGPPAFEDFVARAITTLGRGLADRGVKPVRWWITLNEPNIFAPVTYLVGAFPHGPRTVGPGSTRRALDSLMTAHVLAYRTVHRVFEDHGWDRPMVAMNNYSLSAYTLDRGLLDLAAAREEGVARGSIHAFMDAERPRFEAELEGLRGTTAILADRVMERALLPDLPAALPRYVDALYSGEGRTHDYVAIDYYTPVLADFLRFPDPQSWSERRIPFGAELWESTIRPRGLRMFLHANHRRERPMPVLVAENGMCTRVRGGMRRSRPDGWRRPAFIRAHVAEVLQAARGGVPVAGYLHWSLVDNYEWGSYEPRFGLYGVDRRNGVRIMDTDADDEDSAGVFRNVIAALASGKAAALAALAGD